MSFSIGKTVLKSRLILGTGKYSSFGLMQRALKASQTSMVTVAIRRVKRGGNPEDNLLNWIDRSLYHLLPNTAGCFNVEDALLTARLARELLNTPLIKVEVIGDKENLFPDNEATLSAATQLVKEGFEVLPYCSDDPIICRKLADAGCVAVMPMAAPIGSGRGIVNPDNLANILSNSSVPVIVDAGVGTASDAAIAMELGCTAILMNTAVAQARDPVLMAEAMRHAVIAGRKAYQSGRIPRRHFASASSPLEGTVEAQPR